MGKEVLPGDFIFFWIFFVGAQLWFFHVSISWILGLINALYHQQQKPPMKNSFEFFCLWCCLVVAFSHILFENFPQFIQVICFILAIVDMALSIIFIILERVAEKIGII